MRHIRPALGLGDLLLQRLRDPGSVERVTMQRVVLLENRARGEDACAFARWFVSRLWPEAEIVEVSRAECKKATIVALKTPVLRGKLDATLLHPNVDDWLPGELRGLAYVVWHTKVRGLTRDATRALCAALEVDSRCPVVLLGERQVEENRESVRHGVHTIYDWLRRAFDERAVDLTTGCHLYSGNTRDGFLRDIAIIRNAVLNVTVGFGGNTMLAKCFGTKLLCYVGKVSFRRVDELAALDDGDMWCRSVPEFLEQARATHLAVPRAPHGNTDR